MGVSGGLLDKTADQCGYGANNLRRLIIGDNEWG